MQESFGCPECGWEVSTSKLAPDGLSEEVVAQEIDERCDGCFFTALPPIDAAANLLMRSR